MKITESSLIDLYQSAVDAFPNTTRRQHATNTIKFTQIRWTPFLGVRTLYVRGLAQNEGKEYQSIIVFKNVHYHVNDTGNLVTLTTESGEYLLEPISLENADVLVRCQCADFHWRMKHFNAVDRSLQGPDRKKYEALFNPGSANPEEMEGLCKHLMKMMKVLKESGIFNK